MSGVWTPQEEAKRLAERFVGIKQAEFAREHGVPGGASMLSQHIKGRRPLNMAAAVAYARGFNVPLEQISPRLAATASQASPLVGQRPSATTSRILEADELLEQLGMMLATLPADRRNAFADNLAGFAREGGADVYRVVLLALLTGQSGKRRQA